MKEPSLHDSTSHNLSSHMCDLANAAGRSNHAMYSFFDGLFPNQVASVSIILDVKGLDTLISIRDRTAANLDYALATYASSNYRNRPTFIVYHSWREMISELFSARKEDMVDKKDKSVKGETTEFGNCRDEEFGAIAAAGHDVGGIPEVKDGDLLKSPLLPVDYSNLNASSNAAAGVGTRQQKSSSKARMKELSSTLPKHGTRVDSIDYYEVRRQ